VGLTLAHLKSNEKATGYVALSDKGSHRCVLSLISSVSFAAGAIYSTTGDLVSMA